MVVAVIGSGTMGSGIAQVAATASEQVLLFDSSLDALERSKTKLDDALSQLVIKQKLTAEEKTRIQSNITYVTDLRALKDAALVIEAIIENIAAKRMLFSDLEKIVDSNAILASNTSSLSIASIAAACKAPDRVVGLHFFNPAQLMPLVEVVPAVQTSGKICASAIEIMQKWGKLPVTVKDTPGFLVNRVARPFYGEALRIYEEGIADFIAIDNAVKSVGGFKMGPFELMDFIGNDINYTVTESVFTAFYYDPRYKPSFTQKRLVEAGYLGKKTGRGFYDYNTVHNDTNPVISRDYHIIFERILVMLINEAADALYLNIASAKDLDLAVTKGVNYPKGLLAWADEKGIDWCVHQLDALYDVYREDRYRCSPILRTMQKNKQTFF